MTFREKNSANPAVLPLADAFFDENGVLGENHRVSVHAAIMFVSQERVDFIYTLKHRTAF